MRAFSRLLWVGDDTDYRQQWEKHSVLIHFEGRANSFDNGLMRPVGFGFNNRKNQVDVC